jgi:hypothetical protein
MAPIPNSDRAILEIGKIKDYCLSPEHPRGRHKARVFRDVLDLGQKDAEWLCEVLLKGVQVHDAIEHVSDRYGTRWCVDVPIIRNGKSSVVRTIWIVRIDEQAPRFVTCWVL